MKWAARWNWDQVLPILTSERWILRYDTRGAGMSEKIRDGVTFDVMVQDLAGLLDALLVSRSRSRWRDVPWEAASCCISRLGSRSAWQH
jgi:pimeloyl-ACP methyl ester carboxylesterase